MSLVRTRQESHGARTHFRWVVMGLVIILVLINYIDRSAIAYAIKPISAALHLGPAQWGLISGAFSIGYLLTALLCGPLVDRFGAKRTLATSIVAWSVASVLTAFAGFFAWLFVLRILLGVGEAPAFPASSRASSRWLPKNEQAMFLSLIGGAAVCLSLLIGGPLVTALLVHVGWRAMFAVLGLSGFVWVILWRVFFRDDPARHPRVGASERRLMATGKTTSEGAVFSGKPDLARAWKNTQLWAVAAGFFAWGYIFWGIMYWLPGYLESQYALDLTSVGLFSVLPWAIGIIGSLLGGFILGRMQGKNTRFHSRCAVMGVFILCVGICMVPVVVVHSLWVSVICISLGVGCGFVTGGFWWVAAIETMPGQPALAAGILDAAFGLSGVVAPIVMGYIVGFTGSFAGGFVVMMAVALLGALCLIVLSRRGDRMTTVSTSERLS